jgi:hypothetical protein
MIITRTVTKKVLENIIHETFANFGSISSSSLLDSLKFLGFHYATNAGISINIEDLKTPDMKKDFLHTANQEMKYVSEQWQQGFVSDTERFQTIIDSWNLATESLKDRIIDYYQNFDPANNLYIMAFSGARGNMSQVRQLVGMRGLMSDQEGRIIDLPIQTNFREGLSSIDYIISSYGARKGIVDTALKTADSGYLTRRLIYIAQDLIIRELDCQTTSGVIVLFKSSTSFKNIVGRNLISAISLKNENPNILYKDIILETELLDKLKKETPLSLKIRSPLTCKSNGSICQKCYGWDLAQNKLISLGEAVGIIAAQSIGEPGTQLTMRTFHTGGIFTSELLKQTLSPFSGKIIIPDSIKSIPYRTTHGIIVSKLQQEIQLLLVDWKGEKKEIFLEIGSFLYLTKSGFVKKNELISEYSDKSSSPGPRRLKPIYTSFSGEIRFESLLVRHIAREDKPKVKVNQDEGVLWLVSGKIIPLPKESKYYCKDYLRKNKACAKLNLVSPYSGILNFQNETISISNRSKRIIINLENLTKILKDYRVKFSILTKNYQYIDKYTILGLLNIFPNHEGKIYSTRYKPSKYLNILFLVIEDDVWKINSDQINNFDCFPTKKNIVRAGMSLNSTSEFSKSGFFLKKDGFKMIFQNALPIFLSRGTILNYNQGDFVFEKQILATLANYTQQTEDIVQGLPKIEELIEARTPKNKAKLAKRPGIFINPLKHLKKLNATIIDNDTITYLYKPFKESSEEKVSRLKDKKQRLELIHSVYDEKNCVMYHNKLWIASLIAGEFEPKASVPTNSSLPKSFYFVNMTTNNPLLINGKRISSKWLKESKDVKFDDAIRTNNILYKIEEGKLCEWEEKDITITSYQTKTGSYMIRTTKERFIYLQSLDPVEEYKFPLSVKASFKVGHFVDIAEPITDGVISPHGILQVLFNYHSSLDGTMMGTLKSLNKFQLLLVNSVQAIYQSQGVNISSKHIEIIVRQMTSKVVVKNGGDTPFLPGETVRLSLINEIYKAMKSTGTKKSYKTPKYAPVFLSTTRSSLNKDGFLSAAGFQETKRILAKSAIEGTSDWLRGLKECVIIGRLIPAGSAFLNYKNYLDNIYLFKE